MDFDFSDEIENRDKNEAKEEKKKDSSKLSPDEDITIGVSEADCRKAVNLLARASAHFLVATGVAAEEYNRSTKKRMSPIYGLVFRHHCRDASAIMEEMNDTNNPLSKFILIERI